MAVVRFEVWTRPDTGTFTRKFPIDVVDYRLILGMFGNGRIVISRDHTRLDDILFVDPADSSNDVGTLIRAYVGDSHLHDFYASRMEIAYGDLGNRTATITGSSYGAALERTRLRQFDWNTTPSVEPDWAFGVGAEQADNGSFELSGPYTPPLPGGGGAFDIAAGFEDEDLSGWDSIPANFLYTANAVEPTVDNGDADVAQRILRRDYDGFGKGLAGIRRHSRLDHRFVVCTCEPGDHDEVSECVDRRAVNGTTRDDPTAI